jgi:glycosyltransferase involved in cell wall biosynthesis
MSITDAILKSIRLGLSPYFRARLGAVEAYPPRPLRLDWTRRPRAPFDGAPVVSIVTPNFDYGSFLERTMSSVLSQCYPQVEYVVQDGGSSDESSGLLEQYSSRLTHWQSAPDGGQANAINRGFAHTTGEVMAYLNSDDMLLPGAVTYVARYFARNPEVDVVYGHRIVVDAQDREVGRCVLPPHDDGVLPILDPIPQETMFWRRRIWERAGGAMDESFEYALDWDLILRFRHAGARFVRLPRFLGAFRIHREQKTVTMIDDRGAREDDRLRERWLGRTLDDREIWRLARPYVLRHLACLHFYRFGLFRYGQ